MQIKLLFAAIILLVAQLLLLTHQVDINAHSLSENCEICLQGGNLNNTHTAPPALFIATPNFAEVLAYVEVTQHPHPIFTTYLARAPPVIFS